MTDQTTNPALKPITFKPVAKPAPKDADVSASSQPVTPKQDNTPEQYRGCKKVVVNGEDLVDIANKNHVALQQLRYFNGLNKNTFAVHDGQTIYIPKDTVYVPLGK